jgi:hypothetical protein
MREAELVAGDQLVASRCSSLGMERGLVARVKFVLYLVIERERVRDEKQVGLDDLPSSSVVVAQAAGNGGVTRGS